MMVAAMSMVEMLKNIALSPLCSHMLQTTLQPHVSILLLSPNPAMHVQWAHKIVPSDLIATYTISAVADKLCECLTLAVNM